jgi:hypothetical protein
MLARRGRAHAALRGAVLGGRDDPFLQYPGVEPLADQSQDHTIAYPSLEELP